MADHWKSIANLLGAPGVDEPEPEDQVSEPIAQTGHVAPTLPPPSLPTQSPPPKSSVAGKPTTRIESDPMEKQFSNGEPLPDEALSFKPPRTASALRAASPESQQHEIQRPPSESAPQREVVAEASLPEPVQPEKARRKSSWESLASMFNIKVDRTPPPAIVPKAEVPVAEEPSRAKPPATPAQSKTSTRPDREAVDEPFSFFSSATPKSANPALDAMFGDTPKSKGDVAGWGVPRVVDDLSWEEDSRTPPRSRTDETGSSQPPAYQKSEDTAAQSDEEPIRRGRRRRRGRGGRGASSDAAALPSASAAPDSLWESADPVEDDPMEEDLIVNVGDWEEPESFESADADLSFRNNDRSSSDRPRRSPKPNKAEVRPSREPSGREPSGREPSSREPSGREPSGREPSSRAVESREPSGRPSLPRDSVEGEAADGEPLRRSSRRRRRGRGSERAEGSERTEGAESIARDDLGRPGKAEELSGEYDHEELDEVGSTPSTRSDDDRPARARPSRRGGSSRGNETARPARSVARTEPIDDADIEPDFDSEDDDLDGGDDLAGVDELGGREGGKHRSIPTWADSVASLVEANMENRKRGDNRGAPRGRPRGRR